MNRPTLHLTNFASRSQWGQFSTFTAMAAPPEHVRLHSRGRVDCHAPLEDLRAVKSGRISPDRYRAICEEIASAQLEAGVLSVKGMVPVNHTGGTTYMSDGNTLVCTCARPDTGRRPDWQPFCHLEVWAPYLVEAGWDVVLYGRRLTVSASGGVVWADTLAPYSGRWEPKAAPQTTLF